MEYVQRIFYLGFLRILYTKININIFATILFRITWKFDNIGNLKIGMMIV